VNSMSCPLPFSWRWPCQTPFPTGAPSELGYTGFWEKLGSAFPEIIGQWLGFGAVCVR
jgi:hypothetical protein